jgi:hypothetical protein
VATKLTMADEVLSRDLLDQLVTDTVDRRLGALTWSLCEGVFEEYGSPFWHAGQASLLVTIFAAEEVSAWTGLAVMKRESSFANARNNPHLDDRNVADPFGVHFNEDPRWSPRAQKNRLLIADPAGSYTSTAVPEASCRGYRLPTFAESAQRCAATLKKKSLIGYNPRGEEYKGEVDEHLREILRRTYKNQRLREELQRLYAARAGQVGEAGEAGHP